MGTNTETAATPGTTAAAHAAVAPPYGPWQSAVKRAVDVGAAAAGLVLLAPLLLLIAAAIRCDSRGPALFRQTRIGRRFQPFQILKFRTMRHEPAQTGVPLTVGRDPRITRVGRVLRRTKLDELPQLINVLRGEMSLVGPRPEVSQYVELFRSDYEVLLSVRPGITDAASLAFRNEAELLGQCSDPQREYVSRVLPQKLALSRDALASASLGNDVRVILRTVRQLVCRR